MKRPKRLTRRARRAQERRRDPRCVVAQFRTRCTTTLDLDELRADLGQLLAEAFERCIANARGLDGAALSVFVETAVPDLFGPAWLIIRALIIERVGVDPDHDVEGEVSTALLDRIRRARAS